MNYKKIQNPPERLRSFSRAGNNGFVILFAVTISAILLSIALGIANVAFREIRFGSTARDTNDAFFAADTGIECALLYDKENPAQNAFTGTASMSCAGSTISISGSAPEWTFVITGLGSTGGSCAKVTVFKDTTTSPPDVFTTLTSKGYNIGDSACASSSPNRVEREVRLSY